MWNIVVQYDEVKGKKITWDGCHQHFHIYHVFAVHGQDAYMHFMSFWDDEESAHFLAGRIRRDKDFTPKNKPGVWFKVVDTKPQRLKKEDWKFLLWRASIRMKNQSPPKEVESPELSPEIPSDKFYPCACMGVK